MIRLRSWDPLMGMNLRNARIARRNSSAAIRLVNDKCATKEALTSVGAPTSPTLALLRSRREIASLDWDALPDCWALKPNQSLGGNGILLAFVPVSEPRPSVRAARCGFRAAITLWLHTACSSHGAVWDWTRVR
ncbi:hypothetical protein [Streptomyces sp. NPDC001450]